MNIYIENEKFWNHIVYTFETLFRCIHLKNINCMPAYCFTDDESCIYYGKRRPSHFRGIYIEEGSLFGDNYLKNECMPRSPLKKFRDIPILFMGTDTNIPDILEKGDFFEFNFDFIQSTFFILAGCEEILAKEDSFDIHSRYRVEKRILFREGFVDRPLINIYASILKHYLIKSSLLKLESNPHCAYAFISHDVDYPYAPMGIKRLLNRLPGINLNKKIDKGFEIIIKTEKKLNIQSTWFFKSGGNSLGYDQYYDFQDKEIKKLVRCICEKGDEIGWHYSYNASIDEIQFGKEYKFYTKSMRKSPVGDRGHYLKYRIPKTWRMLANKKILYDATYGAEQQEGFVFGICTPFQLFDAVKGENLFIWEIPLLVMDVTVCMKECQGYSKEAVRERVLCLIEEVKKYDGVFSILWHNTSLRRKRWYRWEKVYLELMKLIKTNLICETGENIIKSYR